MHVTLSDLPVRLEAGFLCAASSDRWLRWCSERLTWEQERVRMFGRVHPCPRLTAFVAEPGRRYGYSGVNHCGVGIPRPMKVLLERVNEHLGSAFDSILLTCYRSGEDRLGWHTDAEPELGVDPDLAVLSLGAPRTLAFRSIAVPRRRHRLELAAGSLLHMRAGTQRAWQHSVPVRRGRGLRISLGFRRLVHT